MKKLLFVSLLLLAILVSFTACDLLGGGKEDEITVVDGYLVVNGVKTEHKVNTTTNFEIKDGYIIVDGVKTEYQVKTEDVIEVLDGYLVVNGVKTEYKVCECECPHVWETVTTEPTCAEGGYDTTSCLLCGESVVHNETPTIAHSFESVYSYDHDYHWYACEGCSATSEMGKHTLDDNGLCAVCGVPINDTLGLVYKISADGTYAEVVELNGTAKAIRIAKEYNGVPVKKIGRSAFNGEDITSVIIPDGVTIIDAQAFMSCRYLNSVSIPASVKSISTEAFSGCSSLTEIEIPDGVMYIDYCAFNNCTGLTSIVIPDSMLYIGSCAFNKCTGLKSVSIPDAAIDIGYTAFYGCTSLEYAEYDGCRYLGNENNPYAALIEAIDIANITSCEVHSDTKIIASNVLQNAPALTSVSIPDGILYVGREAFDRSWNLQYNEYENFRYLGNENNPYVVLVESKGTSMESCNIHEGTKVIGPSAVHECSRITSIVIPDSVVTVCSDAFYGCDSVSSIVFGKGLTTTGSYAFSNISGLTSIVIPEHVKVIGEGSFSRYSNLESVVIINGTTDIQRYAFYDCQNLKTVVIGEGVTNIDQGAFDYCPNLTDVYYVGSEESWAKISIGGENTYLTSATIHFNYVPEE